MLRGARGAHAANHASLWGQSSWINAGDRAEYEGKEPPLAFLAEGTTKRLDPTLFAVQCSQ
eukprot:6189477-Pleurochrysis_carterae.AAC.2